MRGTKQRKPGLFCEYDGLHAGNLKALAAAQVLAGHHVVFAQHVGTGFGEFGAVTVVSAAGKLLFLGTHEPCDFVFPRLLAMGTIQVCVFLFLALVKKLAFVHGGWLAVCRRSFAPIFRAILPRFDYYTPAARVVWQDGNYAEEEKEEKVRRGRNRESDGAGAYWLTQGLENRAG